MSQFDEALRRQDAGRRQAEAAAAQQAASELQTIRTNAQAAEGLAGIVRQSLADMARHLGEKGAQTYKHTWKMSDSRFAAKQSSPRGFVLDFATRGLGGRPTPGLISSLSLLTKDGRLWGFSRFDVFDKATFGYQEVTGETIVTKGVYVSGLGRVETNETGEPQFREAVPFTGGTEFTITPYYDGLAARTNMILERRSLPFC